MSKGDSSGGSRHSSRSLRSQGPVASETLEVAKKARTRATPVQWSETSETTLIDFLLDEANIANTGGGLRLPADMLQAAADHVNAIHPPGKHAPKHPKASTDASINLKYLGAEE